MPNKNSKDTTTMQRLREFVAWAQSNGLCTSISDFEKQCGLSNRYVAKVTYADAGISSPILARIIKVYPMLNLAWLCSGEGEMFDYGSRIDYYKAYREKCIELEIAKKKLSAIEEIIKKS